MLCEDESKCFAWSWLTGKGSCVLEDENWKDGREEGEKAKGFISGTRKCLGSTTKTSTTPLSTTTATTPKSTTPQSTTVTTTRGIYHCLSKNQGKGRNQN